MSTEMSPFHLLKQSSTSLARTGVLHFEAAARTPLATPAFIISTSRGAVPHLTPDNVVRTLRDKPGFYLAAEDFFERKPEASPILSFPESENGIRDFFALPTEPPLVAALRGANPEPLTRPNSNGTVAVTTCEGSRDINIDTYYRFLAKVCPDIILAVPDLPQTGVSAGGNRVRKMLFRTERWLEFLFKHLDSNASNANAHLFVPILPADLRSQALYIDFLKTHKARISGLTLWTDRGNAAQKAHPALPESWDNTLKFIEEAEFSHLPRYNLPGYSYSPFEMLDQIASVGIDIFDGKLATELTEAGVAIDFTFPAPRDAQDAQLGFNLREDKYKVDMTSFGVHTPNFCGSHNRAFVHHLLDAHEMTAMVLLEMHNLNALANFFAGVRAAIADGTFEEEKARFEQVYQGQDLVELKTRGLENVPEARSFTRTK
ncbi:hypothetical protein DV451_004363 [Geotrichum candidum]|uniref:tRNA-guanine(15) transglycosylase-like domain-containing protein n=1 Tax=Geotrichum candidum TaxID=1173061 RepID=A0A9P5G322_GEOCN|nr:hypothetical protein DV451_004363 [Geotrichum candidum]KAF5111602.1 hypothetical protein DV453_000247 [Geotrichum candidum]KAF5115718.1 hypothetical protein DV495_005173 [Geotrichum candidum]KAF5123042.1 hypothetical protein DV452_000362 [Geotrichum candidum]